MSLYTHTKTQWENKLQRSRAEIDAVSVLVQLPASVLLKLQRSRAEIDAVSRR